MKKPPTQGDLARKLGLSQQQVSALIRRGMPLDVRAARRWRAEHLNAAKIKAPRDAGHPRDPDSLETLRRRKLRAEASILERRAAIGPEGLVEARDVEAALFEFHPYGRGVLDAAHVRLLDALSPVCDRGHPQYAEIYTATYSLVRTLWSDVWHQLASVVGGTVPQLRPLFVNFYKAERGRGAPEAKGDA